MNNPVEINEFLKYYAIKNKMPIFPYFIGILYFLGTTLGYKNC